MSRLNWHRLFLNVFIACLLLNYFNPAVASSAVCTGNAWDATTVYYGGQQVYYSGHIFEAKYYITGPAPDLTAGSAWKVISDCTTPTIVSGVCGTSNGGSFSAITTSGLCTTGTATRVNGTTGWMWTCLGSYGGTSQSCSASNPSPTAKYIFSPYKDVTINMDWTANEISTLVTGARTTLLSALPSGNDTVTWAFASGECGNETWGGVTPALLAKANVQKYVAAGVNYIVSTGGAAGAFTCSTDAGFEKFIQNYYSTNMIGIDFDIEVSQTKADIDNLVQRAVTAKAKYPNLRFSFTIATFGGNGSEILGGTGLSVLESIKRLGLVDYKINLMAMDYGDAKASNCVLGSNGKCDMGLSAVQAATSLHNQHNIPYSQIELTPMIGGNDVQDETFTLADVTTVTNFAKQSGLGGLHHWSIDRDVDCATGAASPVCNSYGQAGQLGFTKRFVSDMATNPALAITNPSQATSTTSLNSLTVSGTTTGTVVALTFNNQTFSSVVTNGTFTQQLIIPAEGTYAIVATVTDASGVVQTITRTVTYALPVNGVCGSSNGGSFSVTPATNLCGTGTASSVAGGSSWNWSCGGVNGGTTASCSATNPTPQPTTSFLFSPYKDVTINMDWNTNVISTLVTGTRSSLLSVLPRGTKTVTWAFASGECGNENWGGVTPALLANANVQKYVAAGVNYIISTGGAGGAFTCATDAGFEKFIQSYYSANMIGVDFDIEVSQTKTDIDNLVQRAITAKIKYPNFRFSFTIATFGGNGSEILGGTGLSVLESIKRLGLTDYKINLMAMDYGDAKASNCVLGSTGKCDMGLSAVQAATSLHNQHNIPYSQIELTPMIGGNDVQDETFTLADVTTVTNFAKQSGLGALHHWSIDRDMDCAAGAASAVCNSYGLAGQFGFTKQMMSDMAASPVLAITNPNQATSTTSLNSLTVSGTTTGTAVTLTFNNQTYTPVVTNGTFTQQLIIPAEGTYAIVATVTDASGVVQTETRTVTYAVPVNGVCGVSNGGLFSVAPVASLCSTGAASLVAGGSSWNWSCGGANGGTTATCSASAPTPVLAITSPSLATSITLLNSLTVSGTTTRTAVTLTFNNQTFTPVVTNGAFTQQLTIPAEGTYAIVVTVTDASGVVQSVTRTITYALLVNGVCGSSNGGSFSTAPAVGLCSAGVASSVTGITSWGWSCGGSNGGTTATCSAINSGSSTGTSKYDTKTLTSDPLATKIPKTDDKKVVAYMGTWHPETLLDGTADFSAAHDIPWSKITHMILAFGMIDSSGSISEPSRDITKSSYVPIMNAAQGKDTKLMLSIGGAVDAAGVDGKDIFLPILKDAASKAAYIASVKKILTDNTRLDGIDIDWEWPSAESSTKAPLFNDVLKLTRDALTDATAVTGKPYLLSAAAFASAWMSTSGYQPRLFDQYVDFYNVMTYDMSGSWDIAGAYHQTPLYPSKEARTGTQGCYPYMAPRLSADYAISAFLGKDKEFAAKYTSYVPGWVVNDLVWKTGIEADPARAVAKYWRSEPSDYQSNWDYYFPAPVVRDAAGYPGGTAIISANKLNLGTPFYSHGFKVDYANAFNGTNANNGSIGYGWKGTGVSKYDTTKTDYMIGDIQAAVASGELVLGFDETAQAAYGYNTSNKDFVTFESFESLRAKTNYVKNNSLGGIIIWELYFDMKYDKKISKPAGTGTFTGFLYNELNDASILTVAITSPSQATSTTSSSSITITGTTTGTAVTLTFNGQAFTPVVTSGAFTQQLTIPSEGTYIIGVSVTDASGIVQSVTRSVTYVLPVNGVCGSSNGGSFSAAPLANICSTGTASSVTGGASWSWSCGGTNGGTTATCSASVPTPVLVITSPSQATSTTSLNSLTVSGTTTGTAVTLTFNNQTFTPVVANGAFTQLITIPAEGTYAIDATVIDASGAVQTVTRTITYAVLVNGVCGSSNGGSLSTAPTVALCSTGTASSVAGGASWNWSCGGVNGGTTVTCSAVIDMSGPTITLSVLANGAVTNNAIVNISGTVSDNNGVAELLINAAAVTVTNGTFSHAVTLKAGANTISVVATDTLGNKTTDTRTIILDQIAPALTITAPADNSKINTAFIEVIGTANEMSTVAVNGSTAGVTMNGTDFSATVNLISGLNTINITATDQAGNSTYAKRTVTSDAAAPTLAITSPVQDVTTELDNITISGTVADALTSATVTISVDGLTFTPTVTNGAFSQLISLSTQKIYAVTVTATDEVGNTTSAQRNIIYSKPVVSSATLTVGTVSGIKGKSVVVPITLTNVDGTSLASVGTTIKFDATLLDSPSISDGVAATAAGKSTSGSLDPSDAGAFTLLVYAFNTTAIGNGIVANVTFPIKPTATLGTTTITNFSANGSDTTSASNPIMLSGVNGAIKIITRPGDCDGSGVVSVAEVQSAINMYLKLKPVTGCVDMDGNNAVSVSEVQKTINAYLKLI